MAGYGIVNGISCEYAASSPDGFRTSGLLESYLTGRDLKVLKGFAPNLFICQPRISIEDNFLGTNLTKVKWLSDKPYTTVTEKIKEALNQQINDSVYEAKDINCGKRRRKFLAKKNTKL